MACYRRAKAALDAFRNHYSKVVFVKNAPVQAPSSEVYQNGTEPATTAKFSGFLSYSRRSYLSSVTKNNYFTPSSGTARRYYCVDRYQEPHFRPRGPRKWTNLLILGLAGSCAVITLYFENLETIPYTKRTHFVLLSKGMEKKLGETQFERMKAAFKGKILPSLHPDNLRVKLIATDIIRALQGGLKQETVWSDLGYASPEHDEADEGRGHKTLKALIKSPEKKVLDRRVKENEILDDNWVQHSRKKGQEKVMKAETSHLDGLNWEILVVNRPVVNCFCLPGGKIVVFTGLLEHFKTDAEIANFIGHAVGHAVARHSAERITQNMWVAILQLILYQFSVPDFVLAMSTSFLRLPFSRKMEMEADYIGLLVAASAGYDPRVAPDMYEKLEKFSGESTLEDCLCTHPSDRNRARLLAEGKVMDKALNLYRSKMGSVRR